MQIQIVLGIHLKLSERPYRILDCGRSRCRPRRTFGARLFCERFDFLEKFLRYAVGTPLALMQSYEGWKAAPQAPLRLLIREAREAAEVPPVGAGRITSEATCQFLRGLSAKSAIGDYSSVV